MTGEDEFRTVLLTLRNAEYRRVIGPADFKTDSSFYRRFYHFYIPVRVYNYAN